MIGRRKKKQVEPHGSDVAIAPTTTAVRYAGVRRITHATCSIASGEHQPCSSCAACSAGIAAERKSG